MRSDDPEMQELYQELEDYEKKGVLHQTGWKPSQPYAGGSGLYGQRVRAVTCGTMCWIPAEILKNYHFIISLKS